MKDIYPNVQNQGHARESKYPQGLLTQASVRRKSYEITLAPSSEPSAGTPVICNTKARACRTEPTGIQEALVTMAHIGQRPDHRFGSHDREVLLTCTVCESLFWRSDFQREVITST